MGRSLTGCEDLWSELRAVRWQRQPMLRRSVCLRHRRRVQRRQAELLRNRGGRKVRRPRQRRRQLRGMREGVRPEPLPREGRLSGRAVRLRVQPGVGPVSHRLRCPGLRHPRGGGHQQLRGLRQRLHAERPECCRRKRRVSGWKVHARVRARLGQLLGRFFERMRLLSRESRTLRCVQRAPVSTSIGRRLRDLHAQREWQLRVR